MAISVYLDQNKWIDLLKAATGREDGKRFVPVLEALASASAEHRVTLPLSSGHYVETWKIGSDRQRVPLAMLMAELSRGVSIAPIARLFNLETARAFAMLSESDVARVEVFAKGSHHAHGFTDARGLGPDRSVVEEVFAALASGDATPQLRAMTRERSSTAQKFAAAENDARASFARAARSMPDRTWNSLMQRALGDTFVHQAMIAGVALAALAEWGVEGFRLFCEGIPTAHCFVELELAKHPDSSNEWDEHDLQDMRALAPAIAWCDVVVTEKAWAAYASRRDLGRVFSTAIYADLTDVLQHVN